MILGAWVVSFIVLMSTFCSTAYSNPGIIKRRSISDLELLIGESGRVADGILCDQCHIYRPLDAYHCFQCDCCVRGHDHRRFL